MIATITLNPSIDTVYLMNNFELGKENRARPPHKMAGGKGINAGRTLSLLGNSVITYGLLAGNAGDWVEVQLKKEELFRLQLFKIFGETRTSTTIMHNDNVQTMIAEDGPFVSFEDLRPLLTALLQEKERLSLIIIAGSVTTEDDFLYGKLIRFIRENISSTLPIFFDSSGTQLSTVIRKAEYKPDFMKPNEDELSDLLGKSIRTKSEALQELNSPLFSEIPYLLVSLGKEGAVAKMKDKFYTVEIPEIKVINTTGSGDATVGGFAYALGKGLPNETILKYAMACGMSNACHQKVGFVVPEEIEMFLKAVKVEEVY